MYIMFDGLGMFVDVCSVDEVLLQILLCNKD